ncbi:MFS general substrate transporter [Cristinia sonorae]|uniref:MFS general substrate transporter n=1 Tax=Cristinia sonorae TaxID=1940300 RepID=A0A8K0XTR1_9AGAR|nr:MFS general substrate transporter [Cristinia sonorae]
MASVEHNSVEEKPRQATIDEEKRAYETDVSSIADSSDGDEALKLVGRERERQFSEEYNARLRAKLDRTIPPLCAAVYFTQFLIMGLPITGQNYNLVSLAFYLGFLLWEFPTSYISQKLPLAKYLGANVIIWGIILMLHAATTSFGGFFALRFLLGMCESCVAPILILIISMFYKKNEQGTRISWFYVMNGLTQVFGGFVAYGISFDDGRRLAPYKIIYILLGGLAIIVGICVVIWLPDSPVTARMLTQEERIAALERVRDDQGGTENKRWKKEQIIEALTDMRTWLIVLTTLITSIPNGALSNCETILSVLSFRSKQTLILSTPSGVIASLTVILCGWYSDRKNERMLPIVYCLIPTIIGAAMLVGLNSSGNKGALLFAAYIVGTFGSALSTVYAYNASNTSGHSKKVTINALTLVSFSIGNIVGTEIFQPKDAPAYIPGKIAILVLLSVQIGISLLLRWINIRLNIKKRERLAQEVVKRGWSEADVRKERERHAFMDLTDKQ